MKKRTRIFLVTLSLILLCLSVTLPCAGAAVRNVTSSSVTKVIPGGIPFGVKFTTEGVLIVGFCDIEQSGASCNPAKDAGLRIRDILTHINDQPITSAADLTERIQASAGASLTLRYTRGGKSGTTTLTPRSTAEGIYKTGLYIRDSGAGIGTLTYIVPDTLAFGGLGHGICDSDTGELMPMNRGSVTDVTISGVHRGEAGDPGELRGYFGATKSGTLLGNTVCGVYGVYGALPETLATEQAIPVGLRSDIHEGEATVLCTLASNERKSYTIRISAIDRDAQGSKCFTVQVNDPALLAETGGIVQGMSGSPILQDGKLIGAVTHVLINNPAVGYGIFVENMLAQMPSLLAE